MPPSHVLTDDVSSSSFVLSERTAPLHKGGSGGSSNMLIGGGGSGSSPNKSHKKVMRRRSVDFLLTTSSSSSTAESASDRASDRAAATTTAAALDGRPAPVASVHEYDGPTPEEQEEVWYSRDEYDIIKARNNLIIKMMKGGTFKESDEHTFRGLEHKLKDGFKRRRANKFNALNAVMEVQDSQFARGRRDPDSIAEAYRLVSLAAKETAFLLGNLDAEESYCYVAAAASPRRVGGGKKKVSSSSSSPLKYSSPGGKGRPRHSSLSDLLQQHHQNHFGGGAGPEGGDDDDNNEVDASESENEVDVDDDDDDSSTVNGTDTDTVSSESTAKRRSRLRSMFGAVSLKRKEKINRRTSL